MVTSNRDFNQKERKQRFLPQIVLNELLFPVRSNQSPQRSELKSFRRVFLILLLSLWTVIIKPKALTATWANSLHEFAGLNASTASES